MAKVTFRLLDGGERTIDYAGVRESLAELARQHGIPGAAGECGGLMACATCHVYIADAWQARIGPPSENEADMIGLGAAPRPESRLGCQVWVTPELDGLTVQVAPD